MAHGLSLSRIALLAGVCFLLPNIGFQDSSPIQDLIKLWQSDDAAERNRASSLILEGWETWSPADLRTLALAANGSGEPGTRAKEALGRIGIRRRLGKGAFERFPGIDRAFYFRDPAECLRILRALQESILKLESPLEDLRRFVPLAESVDWGDKASDLIETVRRNELLPGYRLVQLLLKHPDVEIREEALSAFASSDLPGYGRDLALLLKDPEGRVRGDAAEALGYLEARQEAPKIVPLLGESGRGLRSRAAKAIVELGAREVAPSILAFLGHEDPGIRRAAVDTLRLLGARNEADAILPLLGDASDDVKEAAINAYSWLRGKSGFPNLIPLLGDRNPEIRGTVAWEIRNRHVTEAAVHLLPLLRDGSPSVRKTAVRALESVGKREHAPALLPLLKDEEEEIRIHAGAALLALGGNEMVKHVLPLIKDEDLEGRETLIFVLRLFGGEEYSDLFTELLKSKTDWVKVAAVYELGKTGKAEHARAIVPLLKHENGEVNGAALEAIVRLKAREFRKEVLHAVGAGKTALEVGPLYEPLAEFLEEPRHALPLLESEHVEARELGVLSLSLIGGEEEVPTIIPLLLDEEENVLDAVRETLGVLGGDAHSEKIVSLLKKDTHENHTDMIRTLGWMGARSQASFLATFLEDKTAFVRHEAAHALGLLGAVEEAGKVAKLLRDPDTRARGGAIRALIVMGAKEYAPEIGKAVDDPYKWNRAYAHDAWEVFPGTLPVERILRDLSDPNSDIQDSALSALGAVLPEKEAPRFYPFLKSGSAGIRVDTIRAFRDMKARAALKEALPLLGDTEAWVRRTAVRIFAEMGAGEHYEAMAALLDHSDEYVAATAAMALGKLQEYPFERAVRKEIAERLKAFEDGSRDWDRDAGAIARCLFRQTSPEEEVSLVTRVEKEHREGHHPHATVLAETLFRVHEPETWKLLDKEVVLETELRTPRHLTSLLREHGLELRGNVRTWTRRHPGTKRTLRDFLESSFVHHMDFLRSQHDVTIYAEGKSLRVVSVLEALRRWGERLSKK